MKYITSITLAGLLMTSLASQAQTTAYSKPSGFVTHTLKAGQYNLIGLTLHEPIAASGVIGTVNGAILTDGDIDFTSVLTAGKTYILEITDASDASLNGTVQEVTAWSGNTFTTPQNLAAEGLVAGDKYQLRAAKTISDIFGANNESGLQATANYSLNEADVVYIPNGNGFDRYFYSNAADDSRWYRDDFTPSGDIPVPYMDAILVHRKGDEDLDLVLHGSVKLTAAILALKGGDFNYVSTVFPVGSTLGNSGLEASLTVSAGNDINEADVVYMPDGAGGYNSYFRSSEAGGKWYDADLNDATDVPMKSGIVIHRRATANNATLTPPSGYSDL